MNVLKKINEALKTIKMGDSEDVIFRIVDGDEIRDYENIKFVQGGHHYVYNDIPESEIWIEGYMKKEDRVATMAHEFCERLLMKFYGFEYNDAHEIANNVEEVMRDAIPDMDAEDRERVNSEDDEE